MLRRGVAWLLLEAGVLARALTEFRRSLDRSDTAVNITDRCGAISPISSWLWHLTPVAVITDNPDHTLNVDHVARFKID